MMHAADRTSYNKLQASWPNSGHTTCSATHWFINGPCTVADNVHSVKHRNERLWRQLMYYVPLLRHLCSMTD